MKMTDYLFRALHIHIGVELRDGFQILKPTVALLRIDST